MPSSFFRKSMLGLSALTLLALPACLVNNYPREEAAKRVAAPAWMIEREIAVDGYTITAYERMHERYESGHIYIEGDGVTQILRKNKRYRSINPTPVNPVALHLAAHDKHDNVAYIARPCQYSSEMQDETRICGSGLWKNGRYSEEAVSLMNNTINEIKARYNLTDLHLVGYAGGGAIATILAAKRDDIASLRTVAGILDHEAFTHHHDIASFDTSLNPIDFAEELYMIPQHHFIGGNDDYVPPLVLHSYLQALGKTQCAHYTFIQEAEHEAGWVEKWPEFLKKDTECKGPVRDFTFDRPDDLFIMERPAPNKP